MKRTLVISVLATVACGPVLSLRAADTPAAPEKTPAASETTTAAPETTPAVNSSAQSATQTRSEPKELLGSVLAVDKKAMTMTVVVENKPYVLKLTPGTKIVKAGQFKTIDEVLVGEEVRILARETEGGRFEVVGLTILPSSGASAAAGKGGSTPTGNGKGSGPGGQGKSLNNSPFQNFPNPANVGGPIVSPN